MVVGWWSEYILNQEPSREIEEDEEKAKNLLVI